MLKILRLKLVNHIGIMDGLGRKEIEIDFSTTDSRMIIFQGGNGSGKSTIVSTLHPFASTFDNRDSLIIEGQNGLKEIDFQYGTHIFKIAHHFIGSKTKSFMSKFSEDGEEEVLNPAGTTRNFSALVEEHLGVTENFFKLIKIGSQAENFIDLSSSRRKEFIGDFTPNVAPFLTAYANVSARYSATTKDLRYVTEEADLLEPAATINKNIAVLQGTLKMLRKRQTEVNIKIHAQEKLIEVSGAQLAKMEEVIRERELTEITVTQLTSHNDQVNAVYKGKLFNDETTLKELQEQYNTRVTNLEGYTERLQELRLQEATKAQELSSVTSEISRLNGEIKRLRGDTSSSVAQLRDLRASTIADAEKLLAPYDMSASDVDGQVTQEDINTVVSSLDNVANSAAMVSKYILGNRPFEFTSWVIANLTDKKKVTANAVQKLCLGVYKDEQATALKATEDHAAAVDSLEEIKNVHTAANGASCLIGQCKTAGPKCCLFTTLSNVTPLEDSPDYKAAKKLVVETKAKVASTYACEKEASEYLAYAAKAIEALQSSDGNLLDTYLKDECEMSLEQLLFAEELPVIEKIINDIESAKKQASAIRKYLIRIASVTDIDLQLNQMSAAEATVSSFQKMLDAATAKRTPLSTELAALREEIDTLSERITKVKAVNASLLTIIDNRTKLSAAAKTLKEIDKTLEALSKENDAALTAVESVSTLKEELAEIEANIEKYDKDMSDERLHLSRSEDFATRKATLEATRAKLAVIKDALDVKTGIPLILIGEYLNSIRNATNRLLETAFKGRFFIDFKLSDKEFTIPVYKNGKLSTADIASCSQGEISLVKTSLSLGIVAEAIRTSASPYNIVYLDEIDAELDHHNRLTFIDILNRQLDILGSEQCFVITHNNSFFNNNAALVLLPGAKVDINDEAFMQNKEILFNAMN